MMTQLLVGTKTRVCPGSEGLKGGGRTMEMRTTKARVLVTQCCGCRSSEKWPGLRWGDLKSQEQRMRGNDQDRADDSFSGEWVVLLEKGK